MKPASALEIAVVIPTYNRASLLGRSIDSVLRQSKPPSEIVIVDDGSTDETRAQVTAFGESVTYLHQDNAGCASARDRGIRHARADWVALLDSDDFWLDNHLERMAEAISSTEGAARFYFSDTIHTPDRGGGSRWEACGFSIPNNGYALNPSAADWVMMKLQPMMLQSTVMNRAAYLDAGGFLPQLRSREDTHIFLKLGLTGPACAVQGFGAQMTSDDVPANRLSLTYNQDVRGIEMRICMLADLLQTIPELQSEYRTELKRRLANSHLQLAKHALRDRAFISFLSHALRVLWTSPQVFLNGVAVLGGKEISDDIG